MDERQEIGEAEGNPVSDGPSIRPHHWRIEFCRQPSDDEWGEISCRSTERNIVMLKRLRIGFLAAICVFSWGGFMGLLASVPAAAASSPLTWSAPVSALSAALYGVSCASNSQCVGVASNGQAVTSTDPTGGAGAWTAANVDTGNGIQSISCPSVNLCVAGDNAGNVVASTNPTGGASAWTVTTSGDSANTINSISCPSVNLCVAVDNAGNVFPSTNPTGGGTWTPITAIDAGNVLQSISCPSTSLCVGADNHGYVLNSATPTSGSWTLQNENLPNGINSISCPSVNLCVAGDNAGNVVTSTNPTGGAGAWTVTDVDSANAINSISCPGVSFCVAVDNAGNVVTSTNPTGGASAWTVTNVDSTNAIQSISCPSVHLCVAGDQSGNVVIGDSKISGLSFSVSSAAPGASSTWTADFTTSASGALTSNTGTITLTGPSGTVFPATAGDYKVNGTTVTAIISGGTNTASFVVPVSVSDSTAVTVTASNVTNPSVGNDPASDFSVTTSSDVASANPSAGIDFTYAADGSGTVTVSPSSTPAGSVGNTLTFTYTAASGGISGGEVAIALPGGWSTPSVTSGTAGYTTATTGTVGVSGSTVDVTGVTLSAGSKLTVTYGDRTGGGSGATAPSTAGTSEFTVQEKSTGSGTLTALAGSPSLTVGNALAMTTAGLPSGTFPDSYSSGVLTASGGRTPYSWTAAGLPSGLSVTVSGSVYDSISGTPAGAGSSSVTLTVKDATGTSVSRTFTLTIDKAVTQTVLSSGSNPSLPGKSVTYTASVNTGNVAPTGTVAFTDDGTTIGGCGSRPITPGNLLGTATCAVTYTSSGSHSITAVYSGDGNYLSSTSTALSQVVSNPVSSVLLAATPGSLPVNGSGTVQGTVYGASGTVAGAQVTLSLSRGDGGTAGTLGSSSVTADGSGAFSTSFSAPPDSGTVTVTASVYGSVYKGQTVVIVTPESVTVEGTNTAESTGGCATATAATGYTTETGCGTGTFAVAQYGTSNPATTTSLTGAREYFDAAVSTGNTLTSSTIKECNAQSGDVLEWWNPATSAWQQVSPAATLSGTCLVFTANASSTPSLSRLYGTVFALVAPQPVVYGGGGGGGGGGIAVTVPELTGITPSSGPASGGTTVTITGSGFTGAAAVDFGSTAARSFAVQSDDAILAVSPAGSGTVDVTVVTPSGTTAATGSADQFTYTTGGTMPPVVAPPAATFSDVSPSFWAYPAIETLARKGIVIGFPNGAFQPDADVTRAQFVKMLVLTLGIQPGGGGTPFGDVAPHAWYGPYVAAGYHAGIVRGVGPTSFAPDAVVTREQMALLLTRALKLTGSQTLSFKDASSVDPWARSGVEAAVSAGLLNGFPDGTFQPLGPTTRAQAAKVLALVLQKRG